MPAVSVILPTCDRPQLWPRALASVAAQTFSDWEVLLVDSNRDAPPVKGQAEWEAWRNDARVRLLEEVHAPCSGAARNVGLRAVRGEWVTYLDDDDVYCPGKIARQLERARSENADLVLCGYTVVLPRRRRVRQASVKEFCGDALLAEATWCTPLIFHRRSEGVWFDETLRAGDDEVFAQALVLKRGIARVPNCAESLVEMHPQVGAARVHADMEAVWRACRVNAKQVRGRYSREARRAYLAMGRLVRAQGGHGSAEHFARCAWAAMLTRGPGAWRLVANATARRLGVFREWVVS